MTLKHHTYALPLLVSCLLVFYSCNSSSTSSEKGSAEAAHTIEVPKVKIKDESIQLTIQDASKPQHLELPTGSFIDIPANAFVDANGNPVNGKVKLSFKEYHDAADIILGGVPMEYDTAGTKQVLQTAGMFKVEAFSGNDAIQIADGKSVQVSLISTDDGNPYNFYVFDEKTGNWTYTGKSVDKSVGHLKETPYEETIPRAPIAPKAYNPNSAVIDMDIDVKEYPELASLRGLMWQYAGPDAEKDASANAWIFKHKWKKISIEVLDPAQSTFTLNFIDGKSNYKTIVTPVLTGKAFDKAMAKYNAQKEAYDKTYEASIQAQQKGNTVYRVFAIKRTGMYNCDRIWDSSTAATVSATFVTDDPEFGKKESDKVYLVSGGMRTVYRVAKKDWNALRYIKGDDKAIVAVLSNGKFAVFSNEDFKRIGPNMIASGKITFPLKTLNIDETDAESLRKIING